MRTSTKDTGDLGTDCILYGQSGVLSKFRRPVSANILRGKKELGDYLLNNRADNSKEERERELQLALDAAEARATRELRAAVKRLRNSKDEEKRKALQLQKEYYERLAKRIEEQRDDAEAERQRELTKQLDGEKENALREQWEECERLKEIAIQEACQALTRKLRLDFTLEKERAIAAALKEQKERFLIREQETIARTKRECEDLARKEAMRVAKIHQDEVDRLNQKYDVLEKKYLKELDHKNRLENDFRGLQDDYRRFMNYTDGKFHSDYLIKLRYTGMQLANKRISEVSYEHIEDLFNSKHNTFRQ
ncbi:GRB10-interacting GYF protein 2-like isoform X2 [Pecten maximus]|uniref:GRB10-interacting GYF protein 2-like isoform X2 n=1 Tax=Pecten maximus TaxID=6579 RepID=UPI001457EA12|nr:GRB10-interacting GYF protein 2-like isoform X2 [Pecten maximus]